ncbi:hypothetical protein ACJ73_05400, partial [Blastomyces percursus]
MADFRLAWLYHTACHPLPHHPLDPVGVANRFARDGKNPNLRYGSIITRTAGGALASEVERDLPRFTSARMY